MIQFDRIRGVDIWTDDSRWLSPYVNSGLQDSFKLCMPVVRIRDFPPVPNIGATKNLEDLDLQMSRMTVKEIAFQIGWRCLNTGECYMTATSMDDDKYEILGPRISAPGRWEIIGDRPEVNVLITNEVFKV